METLLLICPQSLANEIAIVPRGEFTTITERNVTVRANDKVLAEANLHPGAWHSVSIRVTLPPGQTELVITTDRPATHAGAEDLRKVTFRVRSPRLVIDELKP